MTEQFANLAQTTLASSITASQTTFNVVSSALFPSTGNFRIVVQSFDPVTGNATSQPEIMLVTAVSGNQFTVQRAAESSVFFPAIAFSAGATVANILTAAVMYALESGSGGITVTALTVTPYTATAAAGLVYYPVYNTSGGTFIFKLPASPATSQAVAIVDALNNAGTNNIQVQGNGNTISAYGGTQANITIASNGGSVNPLIWDTTGNQWTAVG